MATAAVRLADASSESERFHCVTYSIPAYIPA